MNPVIYLRRALAWLVELFAWTLLCVACAVACGALAWLEDAEREPQ